LSQRKLLENWRLRTGHPPACHRAAPQGPAGLVVKGHARACQAAGRVPPRRTHTLPSAAHLFVDSPLAPVTLEDTAAGERAAQRRPGPAEGIIMRLKSLRFSDNARLQQAAENRPALKEGEQGEAVEALQQALVDLGLSMPVSTRRTGLADGIYGPETKAT